MLNDINKIIDLINHEKQRQINGLELIASENFVSPDVLSAAGSVLTNKYAEGYPGKRYYGGCEVVDEVENLAISHLKKLFGASWANVQPHSGSQANAAAFFALLKPGDKILGLNLAHGGHLTHGSHVNFSGILFQSCFYNVSQKTHLIDYNSIADTAQSEKPRLIIAGGSSYSRDWDYKKMREIADSVGAFLLADIAHTSGLIAKKLLNNPIPHCHVITSTTHKTLRGPRGGIIFGGEDFEIEQKNGKLKKISEVINSAVFPGMQGGPLEHIIAAKAIAFCEAQSDNFAKYAQKVIANTHALATKFIELGYTIISGGTENHLFTIDLSTKNISGAEAEKLLVSADITVNKNMIPFDSKSPNYTSGIRLGSAALTTRSLNTQDMHRIAELINDVLSKKDDITIKKTKTEINNWMSQYELFYW